MEVWKGPGRALSTSRSCCWRGKVRWWTADPAVGLRSKKSKHWSFISESGHESSKCMKASMLSLFLDLSSGAAFDCCLIVYFKLYQTVIYVKTTDSHADSKRIISPRWCIQIWQDAIFCLWWIQSLQPRSHHWKRELAMTCWFDTWYKKQ